jgi:hypothetical protein
MKPLVDAVGVSFDGKDVGLSSKIANTLQESKNLKNYITKKPDGLIDGISKEWDEVETATTKWTEHWQNIQNNVIPAYNTLIQKTQELIRAEAGEIANNPTVPEDPNANSGDGGGNGSGGNNSSTGNNSNVSGATTWDRIYAAYDHINRGHWGNNPVRPEKGIADGFTAEEVALGQ